MKGILGNLWYLITIRLDLFVIFLLAAVLSLVTPIRVVKTMKDTIDDGLFEKKQW